MEMEYIQSRIRKDIEEFYKNIEMLDSDTDRGEGEVAELAHMYARDAKSYLDKKDFYTAFSCISYAHGLLDALLKLRGKI